MPYLKWKKARLLGLTGQMFHHLPFIFTFSYAIGSVLWILLSDRLLATLVPAFEDYSRFQTYKGWFFVSVSALLIYATLRHVWNGMTAAYEASLESERRLELALTTARGGVWEIDLANGQQTLAYTSSELVTRLGLPRGHQLTMEEFRSRRHPEDVRESERAILETIQSGGRKPYNLRHRVITCDGSVRWVHSMGNLVPGSGKRNARLVGVALDITEQMENEARIERLLRFDPVTGLARQGKFLADVDDALAAMDPAGTFALGQVRFVDLDHHLADNETSSDASVVRMIADRFHDMDEVEVSRMSADTFAFRTRSSGSLAATQHDVRDVLSALLKPYVLSGNEVRLRIQAGAAIARQGATAIALLRNSGHALETAEKGTDIAVGWFNDEISDEFRQRNERIRDLDRAVARGEIECHFQPLVDLRTGLTAGFEALARWRRPSEGLVRPDEFIGLAEEFGQIGAIGEDVLRQACETAVSWGAGGPFVAVNISPVQLHDPAFPTMVARVLARTGLPPGRLELEITENALIRDIEAVIWRLECLRDMGISIAIDDFGTGYSSLSLLTRVPFTRLKVDQSFIRDFGRTRESTIIVDTMIGIADKLGLAVTAEGIETGGTAALLAAKAPLLGQGYLFSKPVPAAQTGDLAGRSWIVASRSCERDSGSAPVLLRNAYQLSS